MRCSILYSSLKARFSSLFSTYLALIAAPILYAYVEIDLYFWQVDTLPEAFALSLIGVIWLFLSMHAINAMALGMSFLAKVLIGTTRSSKPPLDPLQNGE